MWATNHNNLRRHRRVPCAPETRLERHLEERRADAVTLCSVCLTFLTVACACGESVVTRIDASVILTSIANALLYGCGAEPERRCGGG